MTRQKCAQMAIDLTGKLLEREDVAETTLDFERESSYQDASSYVAEEPIINPKQSDNSSSIDLSPSFFHEPVSTNSDDNIVRKASDLPPYKKSNIDADPTPVNEATDVEELVKSIKEKEAEAAKEFLKKMDRKGQINKLRDQIRQSDEAGFHQDEIAKLNKAIDHIDDASNLRDREIMALRKDVENMGSQDDQAKLSPLKGGSKHDRDQGYER